MREILFRGKRICNGVMMFGSLACFDDGDCYIVADDFPHNHYKVDPSTVGQYTGLTDKNGKRIFEDDIVRLNNDDPYESPFIREEGKVYWGEENCGWRRTSNGAFHPGVMGTYRMSHNCVYEVIGNIHDNPELLKEG